MLGRACPSVAWSWWDVQRRKAIGAVALCDEIGPSPIDTHPPWQQLAALRRPNREGRQCNYAAAFCGGDGRPLSDLARWPAVQMRRWRDRVRRCRGPAAGREGESFTLWPSTWHRVVVAWRALDGDDEVLDRVGTDDLDRKGGQVGNKARLQLCKAHL